MSSIAAAWLTVKSGATSSGTATGRWTRLVLDGAAPLGRLTTRRRGQAHATSSCELASIECRLAATDRDVDSARLGLLLHRHPQPQHAIGVVGGNALAVQRLGQGTAAG